ncbi:MAG: GAF and ANTAR domain-containing protein [Kineosporiaceae bacterium]|nr:GAF and ANTAR domain-containing protein [Aeromicrobium sp.]
MGPSSTLTDEPARLDAVRRYDVLDTPPDGAFDRITALAARLCDVPISIVSIVDVDRIWFKSHHGLDAQQTSRDPGLCASAILQAEPWTIADASKDPHALSNPLVAGESGFRFYLGIPLKTHDGFNLGTLCVIDRKPREATDGDIATLRDLAAIVVDELELRLSSRLVIDFEIRARRQAEHDSTSFHKVSESLQAGLRTNREIGQAVGLMMAFHKISDAEAFAMLSKSSQDMNMKLNQIAHQVVRHHNSRNDDVVP